MNTEPGYVAPLTVADAVRLVDEDERAIIAGGTDFFPALQRGKAPAGLVDVLKIGEMNGVLLNGSNWRIGGAATWTDLVEAELPPCFLALKEAACQVGSIQIQNAGTIGGNICNASPAADGIPPLLVLDASVEIASGKGRHVVKLGEFITGVRQVALPRGGILVAVHVPAISGATASAFEKLGSRKLLVISIAMVAALISLDANGAVARARVAIGACSPVATRLAGLENDLLGRLPSELRGTDFVTSEHLSPLSPIDDIRGSAGYRYEAVAELCQRAVRNAATRAEEQG